MEIALTPTEIRVKISFHSAQSEENHSKTHERAIVTSQSSDKQTT